MTESTSKGWALDRRAFLKGTTAVAAAVSTSGVSMPLSRL